MPIGEGERPWVAFYHHSIRRQQHHSTRTPTRTAFTTLSHIPIFTPDEAKLGQKMRISCCPICMYIVKNDSMFLNHSVLPLLEQFLLWKMPQVHHVICPADEEALFEVSHIKDVHEKTDSLGSKSSKSHGSGKSSSKPKKDKDKKDKGDKRGEEEKGDKLCRSESKSGSKTASQEQVLQSPHHSQRIAGSSSEGGHHHKSHKKSKKHGKKSHKSHKKSCQ